MVKAKSETKGVKMGLGDFIGSSGGNTTMVLPNAPRERDPNDDGRFRRVDYRRDTNSNNTHESTQNPNARSERDGDWRGGRTSTSYTNSSSSNRLSSARDNTIDRERYHNDRLESSATTTTTTASSSSSYSVRGEMSTSTTNTGRWSGGTNTNRGGYDTSSGTPTTTTAERPKLNLAKRTLPTISTNASSTSALDDNTPIIAVESIASKETAVELTSNFSTTLKVSDEECLPHSSDAHVSDPTKLPTEVTSLAAAPADSITNNCTKEEVTQPKKITAPEVPKTRFTAAMEADPEYNNTMGEFRSSRRRPNNDGDSSSEIPSNSRLAEDRGDRKGFQRRNKNGQGIHPIPNSRFAAVVAADPDYIGGFRRNPKEERGSTSTPPPLQVQNSRFAAAVAADPDYTPATSTIGGFRRNTKEERGKPPPLEVQNSRFASAVAADPDYAGTTADGGFRSSRVKKEVEPYYHQQEPPLEVQNSRFAAAAAADRDYAGGTTSSFRSSRRYDNDDQQQQLGPPKPPSNTRFAAAIQADADYRDREDRRDFDRGARGGTSTSDGRAGDRRDDTYRRGGGGGGGSRGSYYTDSDAQQQRGRYEPHQRRTGGDNRFRDDRGSSEAELPRFPSSSTREETNVISAADFPPLKSTVEIAALLKPAPPPPVSIPIALPGEDEEAAIARIEKKKKEAEEKKAAEAAEKKRKEEELREVQRKVAAAAEKARAVENDLLQKFTSGSAGYGEDLKKWCAEQGKLLPPVEKLVCELLLSQENYQTPDLNCPWAQPDKFGAALLSLVEDNIKNQIGVLVGIQFYCDKIGFPRLGGEAVVQAMFREMYKCDLAEADAFLEWKEDESVKHERGKQKAIIQTVDWFNWLEEDDEDEDDDADYEEEDEEED